MKSTFIIIIILSSFYLSLGQNVVMGIGKPRIDSSVYGKWPAVKDGAISNDGKYISYLVENKPVGGYTAVVVSTQSKKTLELLNSRVQFTPDSRTAVFLSAVLVEAAVVTIHILNQKGIVNLSFLWLNAVGALGVVIVSLILGELMPRGRVDLEKN